MAQLSEPESLPVPFTLHLKAVQLSEEQFLRLCEENSELRLELTAQGELIIMPPTEIATGKRNSRLTRHLDIWAEADGSGFACDSSTLFTFRLPDLQSKMQEYIVNGAKLGWLIDPFERRVYVYRPDQPMEELVDPTVLNGDPVLPGFALPVHELW